MLKTLSRDKLSAKQAEAFTKVIEAAGKDDYLYAGNERDLLGERKAVVILQDDHPVGFYSPKQQLYKGVNHWRAGTLYLMDSERGKGVMRTALAEFFKTHSPGLAWIADVNEASQNLFKSLGFVKDKLLIAKWGESGHWWVLPKQIVSTESIPIYFKW